MIASLEYLGLVADVDSPALIDLLCCGGCFFFFPGSRTEKCVSPTVVNRFRK